MKFDLSQYRIANGNSVNLVIITDPGKDLDDEQALVAAAGLHKVGLINLRAVVANLEPPEKRAQLAKGTLRQLGLSDVPVGIGSDCFRGGENLAHETEAVYIAAPGEVEPGAFLLLRTCSRAVESGYKLVIVCNSGLTDAARLVMDHSDLVHSAVERFVIMGGVKSDGENSLLAKAPDGVSYLLPDDAANNSFDWAAALYLYQKLQDMGIGLTVVMREAAYGAQFPFSTYDRFAATGNPVGSNLLNRQRPAINMLWRGANAPAGASIRGKLPVSRNRQWFVNVFCDGVDPGVGPDDDVWGFTAKYNQYDTLAVIAAVPELRYRFFNHVAVNVKDTDHLVIGLTKSQNGIQDGQELCRFVSDLQVAALSST